MEILAQEMSMSIQRQEMERCSPVIVARRVVAIFRHLMDHVAGQVGRLNCID